VSSLSLIGGGARSPLWAQLLASLFGVAMRVHEHGAAGAALGAARLAWLADGGEEEAVCRVPDTSHEFVPDPVEAALLLPRRERFRALYPALRDQFGARRVATGAPMLAAAD
jgi:xylulokinase